jgi:hypothetical protein
MGESIKFAVEYTTHFERENFSGTLFSHASIAQEMYDHSTLTILVLLSKVFKRWIAYFNFGWTSGESHKTTNLFGKMLKTI